MRERLGVGVSVSGLPGVCVASVLRVCAMLVALPDWRRFGSGSDAPRGKIDVTLPLGVLAVCVWGLAQPLHVRLASQRSGSCDPQSCLLTFLILELGRS